jgi:hypothetical protein
LKERESAVAFEAIAFEENQLLQQDVDNLRNEMRQLLESKN